MKAASIGISILDAEDKPVEPPVLDLETNYTFQIGVTNLTKTSGGEPWEALFEVGIEVSLDGIDLVPYTISAREFAPNQSIDYTAQIYTKSAYAGMTGVVIAKVVDPFGGLLAKTEKRFTIGYKTSPYAVYQVPGDELPFLSPAPAPTEVTVGGVSGRPLYRQPTPPKPKVTPIQGTKEEAPGISCPKTPEPEPEFEGETVVGGRLG